MRLHRFYIQNKIGDQKQFTVQSPGLVNQIKNVFRLNIGDSVIMFDGSGSDFICSIQSLEKDRMILRVDEIKESRFVPKTKVTLFAAIIKKDRFEWIVEKATELGVSGIVPILSKNCEKKALNEDRLCKIAIEASEQSGRGDVPVIYSVTDFEYAATIGYRKVPSSNLVSPKGNIKKIAFHTQGDPLTDSEVEDIRTKYDGVSIFIGPEGGWSADEIASFRKNDISIRCLGSQILRAETAVVAVLSQIVFRTK